MVDLMQRGFRIGQESESSHMMRYEEALHLPIPEAREKLGYRHAEDVDTVEAGLIFAEETGSG